MANKTKHGDVQVLQHLLHFQQGSAHTFASPDRENQLRAAEIKAVWDMGPMFSTDTSRDVKQKLALQRSSSVTVGGWD